MIDGGQSLASAFPEVLQVQHDDLCTPETTVRPPESAGEPPHRRPALRSNSGAATPSGQLRRILSSLTALLREEYRYVFNHNLGVQSGTAGFAENIQARRLLALCKRAYTLMTTHAATCMPAFHQFANGLDEEAYDRLLHVFDMFSMEELTDFIRMTKPRLTNKLALDYTISLRPSGAGPANNLLTTAASLGPLKERSTGKSLHRTPQEFKSIPAVRVQKLVAAGCPILKIASQLAEEKRQSPSLDSGSLENPESGDTVHDMWTSDGSDLDRPLSFTLNRRWDWMQQDDVPDLHTV